MSHPFQAWSNPALDNQASRNADARHDLTGIRSLGGTQAAPRPGSGDTMTIRHGGKRTEDVEWTFRAASTEDPVLVVRRVGPGLARIEDFSGAPYSAPMPVSEAISALLAISGP